MGIETHADVYNEAFDNGVDCGVESLMFYVKQGKKEIDINEVHNKAQEIRKAKVLQPKEQLTLFDKLKQTLKLK